MRKYYILTVEMNHVNDRTEYKNVYIACYSLPNAEEIKEKLLWIGSETEVIITFAMQITVVEFDNGGTKLIFD